MKGGVTQQFLHVTIITSSNSFTLFITFLSHFHYNYIQSTDVYGVGFWGVEWLRRITAEIKLIVEFSTSVRRFSCLDASEN